MIPGTTLAAAPPASKGKLMSCSSLGHRFCITLLTLCFAAALPVLAEAQTLERIQAANKIVLGFETDARPFSFDDSGKPAGFSVALCNKVVDEVKSTLNLPELASEWTPINTQNGLDAVRNGTIDLLCGANSITLTDSATVSFSLPIFPGGTGVVLRSDALQDLRALLTDEQRPNRPIWRGAPARTFLDKKVFSAVSGSTSEDWLNERVKSLLLSSEVAPVSSYEEGLQRVADGQSAAFFGSLPILLNAVSHSQNASTLTVLPRQFTYEPIGLVLARGDEDFRLVVNRALSHVYRDKGFRELFTQWFGTPEEALVIFFTQTVLPD
ncbi:amino acid ABC transporter substrate-binding protein [Paracoccus actinidiae]|uniref:amino acid ABC transporter substrate-binding protein n=1 Tax=Paracoccus actinidiae TaxID=3064531 RepID=UPI0027D22895|nr:amino acid ABC transporter substrate-binding protein [Paracoccus sp. M09]